MNGQTSATCQVIVLGAGACGLAAAKALHDEGIRPIILEKGKHIGESWYHRHPQLSLNTHRSTSVLPGLAFPRSVGAFPTRNELIDYLHNYAIKFNLDVRLNTLVTKISRGNRGWLLQTESGNYLAEHLVIASGFDRVPHIPAWPGLDLYRKPCRHAAQFGDVNQYIGKDVLVVGAGNSGVDILNHLSRIDTGKLWLSVRQGSVIIPTRMLGLPMQPVAGLLEKLPIKVADALLNLTERINFGDLHKYGLSRGRGGAATRLQQEGIAPGIDNGFIRALKAGKVLTVPAIQHFTDSTVILANGETIEPDIILFATGYHSNLHALLGEFDVLDSNGVPRCHGTEQDAAAPGLWFTGMRVALSGFFLAAGKTGQAIAKAIAAQPVENKPLLPAVEAIK